MTTLFAPDLAWGQADPATRVPTSFLIHGPSKVGKSEILLTCPAPILFADIEGQTRFLSNQDKKWDWDMVSPFEPPPGTLWVRVRVTNYSQIEQMYAIVSNPNSPFKTFAVDSISELQQKYIDRIAGANQMQTQDWGELLRGLATMIRKFRDLLEQPGNLECVAITAMSKKVDGKDSPALQGQLATMINYFLDVVGFYAPFEDIAANVSTRRLHMKTSPFYEAGSRIPWTPPYVDNPNLAQLMVRPG